MQHGISGDKPKTRIDNLIQCNKEGSGTLLLAFHTSCSTTVDGSTSQKSMVYAVYGFNDYSETHLLRLVRFVITMWGETKKVTTIYLWSWKYSSISHERVLYKLINYLERIITTFKAVYLDDYKRNNLLMRFKKSK